MEWLTKPETWVAVSFVLFVVVALVKGRGIIIGTLDTYVDKVTRELDEARTLRDEAAHLLADAARAEKDAQAQAEAILTDAKERITAAEKEASANTDRRIQRLEALATERIRIAQEKAIAAVIAETADKTEAAIRRVLVHRRDTQKDDTFIESSITDLKSRLH